MVNITFFSRMTADPLVGQKKFFGLASGWIPTAHDSIALP
jgi:hypothetical protein